jgi:hypothetical protein
MEPVAVTMRLMGMPNQGLRHHLASAAAVAALFSAAGCSGEEAKASAESTKSTVEPSVASQAESSAAPAAGRFDPLSISLTLRSTTVQQGKTLRSRATIENNSTKVVVDPACVIGEGRYALVPVDGPETADIWFRPMTDCGGPYRMPPGYRDEYRGPDFFARTITGDPLPPGEYLAVLDIRGRSQRLEYAITVTR